jgi:LuxR family maltose regulon positive regulatory protein
LRAADLQFTPAEATEFLNHGMGLNLSDGDVAALETRTEGWIAGLQMAAISMQGLQDIEGFIQSFTGSHRFVMDYLLEEVLSRQPENIQIFLQKTSILDRLCGTLCDALLFDPSSPGQSILEYLEHANLFIIPQDNDRCWFRYHHLFASLLRKKLGQSLDHEGINRLHFLASEWFENNDMILEAFRHAAAANDIERAIRLMESNKMPLYLRGTVTTILDWLVKLPESVLNAQPSLWWKQAELLLLKGQITGVEEKLEAAEAALAALFPSTDTLDSTTRDLIGKIAAIRSNLAVAQQNAEAILIQTNRALEFLLPDNLAFRSSVTRDMGFAYNLQGKRTEAGHSFAEALSISIGSGDAVEPLLSIIGLAQIYELENKLYLANEYYQRILPKISENSIMNAGVVYIGMARIHYQWNNLGTAEKYIEQSLQLAQQFSQIPHRLFMSELLLAQLKLASGDLGSSLAILTKNEQIARRYDFPHRIPNVISAKVMILLRQGDLPTADQLTLQYDIPITRARVLLAQGKPSAALSLLESFRKQMEVKNWQDERLKTIALQAVAFHLSGDDSKALECLSEAMAVAEPDGFIRLFLDEGAPMAELLSIAASQGIHRDYVTILLTAFESETTGKQPQSSIPGSHPPLKESALVEPLSPREWEILHLLAKGLSNQQICQRLYLALDTVKGHNRKIFDKLDVKSRSEAVARARELGLL